MKISQSTQIIFNYLPVNKKTENCRLINQQKNPFGNKSRLISSISRRNLHRTYALGFNLKRVSLINLSGSECCKKIQLDMSASFSCQHFHRLDERDSLSSNCTLTRTLFNWRI